MLDDVDSSTNFNWLSIIKDIAALRSYEDLKSYILRTTIPPNETPLKIYFDEGRDELDDIAVDYLPRDAPNGYCPIKIGSDGNCGLRAFANALLHDKKRYNEVCVSNNICCCIERRFFLE